MGRGVSDALVSARATPTACATDCTNAPADVPHSRRGLRIADVSGSAEVRLLTGLQRCSVVHVSEMWPSNCWSRGHKSDTCAQLVCAAREPVRRGVLFAGLRTRRPGAPSWGSDLSLRARTDLAVAHPGPVRATGGDATAGGGATPVAVTQLRADIQPQLGTEPRVPFLWTLR